MYLIKVMHYILIAGIVSFTGGIFYSKTVNNVPLETPKNIEVLGLKDAKDLDICKQYNQKSNNLAEINTNKEDIQENIGYKNNKFGLYIYRVDDFAKKTAELVNSNGGDWGYVLVPYNVKDYEADKWNSFFQILNEYHLIPIIQLWDVSENSKDAIKETKKSAEFLNSLNWPIEKRYISVYNEVNDERFWKTGINPKEYAWLLNETINIYKKENKDFFIMNGAFNASARTGKGYLDAEQFLIQMDNEVPGIFEKLDGWASHPYPHVNGYLGTPQDTGRDSIRAYEWELQILENNFGVENLPVFITETGWPHAEGEKYNSSYVSEKIAAQYMKETFENVWLPDDRVVAVTPFTIKYDPPFDHFSWIKQDGSTYEMYDVVKDMEKQAGKPPVVEPYDPLREKCKELNF